MAPILQSLSLAGAIATATLGSSSSSSSSSYASPSTPSLVVPPASSASVGLLLTANDATSSLPPSLLPSDGHTGYLVYTNGDGQDIVCFVAGLDAELACEFPRVIPPPRWHWTHWTQTTKSLFTGSFGLLGEALYRGLEHLRGHSPR